MSQVDIDELLRSACPLIDLRAPAEFVRGSVPGAVNLPILIDSERHQVGLRYRSHGSAAATATGEQLVQGAVKQARIDGWERILRAHPQAAVFCWRGGLRTQYALAWLRERGLEPNHVAGGFKAIRARCLQVLENDSQRWDWTVLGGRTGVGKTIVLQELDAAIDLERLARHRGSAFGAMARPQPTQIDFENRIAAACLRRTADNPTLILEDESRTIGKVALPSSWHQRMQRAPLVVLEASLEKRATHIAQEYVHAPIEAGIGAETLKSQYLGATARIRRRLGGARCKSVQQALTEGFRNGDHLPWICLLLETYYDPMYDYQLESKQQRIVFRGSAKAVLQWLQSGSIAG